VAAPGSRDLQQEEQRALGASEGHAVGELEGRVGHRGPWVEASPVVLDAFRADPARTRRGPPDRGAGARVAAGQAPRHTGADRVLRQAAGNGDTEDSIVGPATAMQKR